MVSNPVTERIHERGTRACAGHAATHLAKWATTSEPLRSGSKLLSCSAELSSAPKLSTSKLSSGAELAPGAHLPGSRELTRLDPFGDSRSHC